MEAKEYLEQVYLLNEMIKSNQEELMYIRETNTCVNGIDYSDEKVSGGGYTTDATFVNGVIEAIELEEQIKKDIARCITLKDEIRTVINGVVNPSEKLLLRLKFINFKKWKDIEEALNVSPRTAKTIYYNALKNIVVPT